MRPYAQQGDLTAPKPPREKAARLDGLREETAYFLPLGRVANVGCAGWAVFCTVCGRMPGR